MAPRATDLVLSLMTFLWFPILLFRASAQRYGIATFYTSPYKPSACYGFEDQGVMIAAASEAIWNGSTTCGQHYQVTCLSRMNLGVPKPCRGSALVVMQIVDRCPANACRGTIHLSQEASASIAVPNAGAININY
ncbi:hypothetical protein ACJRO7_016707 [Eucalyptus globulus]|uniref:Expansin-like EG45 domain-containing protein n=1 Tax=Eucalyptus globulus TaxID=34317 RepID=A0ABD3LBG1_EUCGL